MNIRKIIGVSGMCGVLCIGSVCAAANPRVYVNGQRAEKDAVLLDDTTYIPVRAMCEALGANVSWDAESQSVFVTLTEDDIVAKTVEDVSPSIVTIVGNYSGNEQASAYNNLTMHGTGVIYKSNGHIVTNAHVVDGIKNLTVVLNNGELYPGTVLYSDEKADLAVVKIDKIGLRPVTMAKKEDIVTGKTAIAIGTPISLSMRNTVTKGIISGAAVALNDSYYKLIQTDATINPGNSGGPLLNLKGEVIGINSSKYADVSIDNVGFAIPADTVSRVIAQFETYGKILRPNQNFTLEQSPEARIGLPTQKGLTVRSSENDSLAPGDVITAVNGIKVHSTADWNEALKSTYDGTSVIIDCVKGGEIRQMTITM